MATITRKESAACNSPAELTALYCKKKPESTMAKCNTWVKIYWEAKQKRRGKYD